MGISEQVKELRELADGYKMADRPLAANTIYQAADTIEALSAKLQAANMERSDRYCNGDILSEILENLDKRIGTHLKIMTGLNDTTQRYGYAKALYAYQQIKNYVEITIEEHKEKRSAEDCGGWIDGNKVVEQIENEIDGVIVKDTYSKGKNAGLRKAKIFIEEQMNHKP